MEAVPKEAISTFRNGASPMANDVTLSDVAEASGVSVAAASRALNGREGVRTEVRARVKLVAHATVSYTHLTLPTICSV